MKVCINGNTPENIDHVSDAANLIGFEIAKRVRAELSKEGRSGFQLDFFGVNAHGRLHFELDNGAETFAFTRATSLRIKAVEDHLLVFCLENTTDPVPYDSPLK